ncbi:MAG: acyloxyacyl hydrolase [Labilibaculum antarcticum]
MLKRMIFLLVFLRICSCCVNAQVQSQESKYLFFIEPELMLGKTVSNYNDFPKTDAVQSVFLSVGIKDTRNLHSSQYYNHPTTGLSFSYSNFGNDSVLGKAYGIMPFIQFHPWGHLQKAWSLKFGMGGSYFTKSYKDNEQNLAIGSKLTWSFQAFLYRELFALNRLNFRVGAGYLHSSNGHTKLPNMGLNSAHVSLACQWNSRILISKKKDIYLGTDADPDRKYFINVRTGLGIHEYGGKSKPVGGEKGNVYSTALSGGILFKQHLKVRAGFTYRFYEHYYDQIEASANADYIDSPSWNASNIYFHLGSEFLIGHFGLDIEGGLNLFKPFYSEYYKTYGGGASEVKYKLKKYFSSRMGLNFYFINTNKLPKNNFFIGANINANFGQADFSEVNFGYTYTFL